MRIGFGAAHLNPLSPSGLNRYSAGVLEQMTEIHPDVVVYAADPEVLQQAGERGRRVRPTVLSRGNFTGNFGRMVWHQSTLPRLLRRDGCSLYYCPLPEGMVQPNKPQVITIHDVLPLIFPEDNPRLKYYYRAVLPRVIQASSAVITDSASTRADVERLLSPGDVPIHVVYQGFRSDLFHRRPESEIERVRHRYGVSKYLIAVGETRRYKNIRRLIEAFGVLDCPDLSLVIAGKVSRLDREIRDLPATLGIAERVRFVGTVSDADLAALYSGARALVFPSLYEGFGIPPLEAMGCGCPVVTSRRASLPEVCGDAALYVDPLDVGSIARGITEVLESDGLAEALRGKGTARAGRFDYRHMAADTLEILHGVGSGRSPSQASIHGGPEAVTAGASTPTKRVARP